MSIDPVGMPDWLAARAATLPHKIALITAERQYTFAELDVWVGAMARRLRALGTLPGERVGLLVGNSADVAAVVYAAPRSDVVLVPLNVRLAVAEMIWQVRDAGVGSLIVDSHHRLLGETIQAKVANLRLIALEQLAAPDAPVDSGVVLETTIRMDATATIIYTSGTTGTPKGAMLTYGSHWWSAIGSALNLGTHGDDRWLLMLPMFHVSGLSILMRGVIYGITVVLHDVFDPQAVNHSIDQHGVTIISVVSTTLQRLLDERGDRPYPPGLRCVLLGGGPAPAALLDTCAARQIPVVQTYGLSETASQVTTLTPADALRKLGSAGKPLLPNSIRIALPGGDAATGEVGEILVRGPSVMAGYLNRPDATAEALRDGWLHTGDLGYLDDEGYLYVVDRRNDLIITGGENVYPAEVESVLSRHPAVAEAGVVGLADATWQQVPVAFVVPKPGQQPDAAEIRGFCAGHLAAYKVPRLIHFVAELPRNAAGKLVRYQLRAAASEPDNAVPPA